MRYVRWSLGLLATLAASAAVAGDFAERHGGDPRYAEIDAAVDATKAAMMFNPNQALGKSRIVVSRAQALPPSRDAALALATGRWLESEALIRVNRPDDAVPLIAAALATVTQAAPDTKLHGDLIRARGAIAASGGHLLAALSDYQAAFRIFRAAGVERSEAMVLQDIGTIYQGAHDYERVLRYNEQANEIYHDDPGFELSTRNNIGEMLRKLGRNAEAEREFAAALALARKLDSPLLEVGILNNLALAQVENGHLAAAKRSVAAALSLTRSGEAAGSDTFVLGVGAKAAAAGGDTAQAASLLDRMFAGTDLKKTEIDYADFHRLAASVYATQNRSNLALAHLNAFQRLDSEARDLVASSSSQLMAARFDFTNQNLKISQLKRGQLERDISLERQRSQFRTWLLAGLSLAGSIIFGILFASYLSLRRSRDRVRAANVELAGSNTALEKALQAKTEFLAMTSHEIRTPLNGILGMTQVMLANPRLDRDVADQVKVVHGAGEAMRSLVDDILDVAKMEASEIAVVADELEIAGLLRETVALWQGHADAKHLTLTIDDTTPGAWVRSDPARLRQILSNLLSNAVKFTLDGAITVRVERYGDELAISVHDTGIGISDEHIDAIFEPFHQVDGGMSRQFSGTGLGLAICRNLATALGGSVTVRSEVGQGSVFTLVIPAIEPRAAAPVAPHKRPTRLADAALLLVEANVLAQGVLQGLLTPLVGSLRLADDASAALAAIASGAVDHIVIEGKSAAPVDADRLGSLRQIVATARQAGVLTTILFAPDEALPVGDVAMIGADQIVLKPVGGVALIAALTGVYGAADPVERSVAA